MKRRAGGAGSVMGLTSAQDPRQEQDPQAPQPPRVFQTLDRTARYPYARSEYARRFAWLIVQKTLFRLPLPRTYGWRRMWLRLFGAKLGTAAAVHATTRI